MKKSVFALLAASFLAINAQAANNDEWWEYSMEMEGMGGISMPAQKDCYRKDNIVPSGGGGDDCTQSNVKHSGNKFSANFSCKDGTTGRMEGSSTGSESSFKMTSKSAKGETMTMTSKGKKVGSCNWETDSSEAKACAGMNKAVATNKADIKKECETALKNNDFSRFIGGTTTGASADLAGKKCGGNIDTGCSEQRPKMCTKITGFLKETSGNNNGFKKVMEDNAGVELTKQCNIDTAPPTKQFCSDKMKDAKNYQGDIVKFCESDAKALYAQHCAGRDYTAQMDSGYGGICSSYGKPSSASGQDSANTSSSSGDASKGTNPIEGAVKGVKKLKDVFGF
ncbi:MAG TPA: DUF3617 family protein [Methylotenera sp.]|nr:DUF3617 family protein [Methylotenera sp.]HPH06372.1 DUF3617 family protein [Methylotenera sp.]HPN00809.1 DUF3617 family protein [Methylotenera sp.]